MRLRRVVPVLAALACLAALVVPVSPGGPAGAAVPPSGFSDVPAHHPFADEIGWLVGEGITDGYGDGTFRPTVAVSRQAMAAFLYRFANQGVTERPTCTTAPFPDVAAEHPFCGEIAWLVDAGITQGYPDGDFRGASPVSRQAMAAFLHRFADKAAVTRPTCAVPAFVDVTASHQFCGEIAWLVDEGISDGYPDGTFRGTDPVSRQAMAAFLQRLDGYGPGVNELAPETEVIAESDTAFTTLDPDGTSTLTYTGPEVIDAGDVVVTTIADGPFYGRVTDVDGDVVTTEPATLMDAVPKLDLAVSIDTETGQLDLAAPTTGEAITVRSAPAHGAAVIGAALTSSCSDGVAGSVTPTVDIDTGQFELDAEWSAWRGPEHVEVGYTPTFSVSFTADAPAATECSVHADLLDVDLPTIELSIGAVPVWITQTVAADVDGTISLQGPATTSAGFTAQGRLGSRYENGGFHLVDEFAVDRTVDTDLKVGADAHVDVPVDYSTRAQGLLGFDAAAGPFADLDLDPTAIPWRTLDAGLHGAVTAELELASGPIDYRTGHTVGPEELARWRVDDTGTDPDDPAHQWPGPRITTATLPAGTVGEPYATSLAATGGTPPYTWHATPPLPAGLDLDPATGAIAGTPTTAGSNTLTLSTTDTDGYSATRALTITVNDVVAPTTPVRLAAGDEHVCGLRTDGTATCWGYNNEGQATPPTGTFTHVTVGRWHTCGLRPDGTATCWGHNEFGEATPLPGTFTHLAAGSFHTCGLRTDGTASCWGNDSFGAATPPAGTFTQLTTSSLHTCGVRTDGTVTCWGSDTYGQATPPEGTFTDLAAGSSHTCGVRTDGTVTCWGENHHGQATPPSALTQITTRSSHTCGLRPDGTALCWGYNGDGEATPPPGTFTQLSAGAGHTCGLRPDETAVCWGNDTYGEATPPPGTFTQLTAGARHTCGLRTDGTAACWGDDDPGLGVTTPAAGTFTDLAGGWHHVCGLRPDGAATCWGYNPYGEATAPLGTFTRLTAGADHTCGLRPDGTATCWGDDSDGRASPPAGTFTHLAAGTRHTCGLRPDGTATCWGDDSDGRASPPAGTFTHLAAASSHTCGLRPAGYFQCWGFRAALGAPLP